MVALKSLGHDITLRNSFEGPIRRRQFDAHALHDTFKLEYPTQSMNAIASVVSLWRFHTHTTTHSAGNIIHMEPSNPPLDKLSFDITDRF